MNALHVPPEVDILPVRDRILVRVDPKPRERQTESGIYMPELSVEDRPLRGTVIRVGEGTRNPATGRFPGSSFTPGTRVVWHRHHGSVVGEVNGVEWVLLIEDEVWAIENTQGDKERAEHGDEEEDDREEPGPSEDRTGSDVRYADTGVD